MAQGEVNPVASGIGPRTEFDEEVDGQSVLNIVNQCRYESEQARRNRLHQNDRNWSTFLGEQDFSGKMEGQSQEFLPKVPISAEQLTSTFKKGMTQFGDWFSVQLDAELEEKLDGETVRSMLQGFLKDMWAPGSTTAKFPTVVTDAIKQALFKCLMIFKVGGATKLRRKFSAERDENGDMSLRTEEEEEWKLRIDCVRFEDYYPDPSGNGLYEIQRSEVDLHEIVKLAEQGIYDKKAVDELIGTTMERPEDEKLDERDRGQEETTPPGFRKKVLIDEFWGTLLNQDGTIAMENCVTVIANERYVIRKPEHNPFWHDESPFVAVPLVRMPFSVFHKALYDHAADLNLAINEMFNLMLDGGIAAVHGVKQIRVEDLEDPSQIENGIKQGTTLVVKQTLPHNAKVLETVTEGDVPQDAMAIYEMLNKEFSQASLSNQIRQGSIPSKDMLATELIEAGQGQDSMLEGILADVELMGLSEVLRKAWLVILQEADRIPDVAFSGPHDKKVALMIMRAEPEERFALFAGRTQFDVSGLSNTLRKALDFQKFMALMQAITTNPMLFQAFMADMSPTKALRHMMKMLNINPFDFQKSAMERQNAGQEMAGVQQAAQVLGKGPQSAEGGPAGVAAGPTANGSSAAAGIQQTAQPTMGLPANA